MGAGDAREPDRSHPGVAIRVDSGKEPKILDGAGVDVVRRRVIQAEREALLNRRSKEPAFRKFKPDRSFVTNTAVSQERSLAVVHPCAHLCASTMLKSSGSYAKASAVIH